MQVRMQAFIDKDHPQHSRYDTVSKTIRHTIQDEGAGALLKGVGPRAFRITCATTALLLFASAPSMDLSSLNT